MTTRKPLRLKLTKIEANGSLIILIGRQEGTNERWTVQVTDFRPYFYVPALDIGKVEEKGLDYEGGFMAYVHEDPTLPMVDTLRVFTKDPADVGKRRKGFDRTWEADIPYTRRFLIDTGIRSGFQVNAWVEVGQSAVMAETADIQAADEIQAKDRRILYDIETNKPEGERKYSPATIAAGAVTAITHHDSFEEGKIVTRIWHPRLGNRGRPKTEHRRQYSEAFGRNVDWEILWFGTEEEMLLSWAQMLKTTKPDVLAAWNGHYGFLKKNQGGFDTPYVINRMNRLKLGGNQLSPLGSAFAGYRAKKGSPGKGLFYCTLDGIQLIDQMSTYAVKDGGFLGVVPFSGLKDVLAAKSQDWKGGAMRLEKDPPAIEEWWANNTEKFLKYSFRDVDAIVALEIHEQYIDYLTGLQRFSGLEDANIVFRSSTLVATLELRKARDREVCLPTAVVRDEDMDEEVSGGFVLDPRRTGVIPLVGIIDLNKMYVAIIQSCNISYETWVPDPEKSGIDPKFLVQVPTDKGTFYFRTDIKGLTPEVLDELVTLRDKYDALLKETTDPAVTDRIKKERMTLKNLILTAYGQFLSLYNRLRRLQTGAAVTGAGQNIIKHVDETLANLAVPIFYGDTDSAFLAFPEEEDPVEFGHWVAEQVNKSFDTVAASFNVPKHNFKVEFEVLYNPFVIGHTKKRYAGKVVWENGKHIAPEDQKIRIKGLEGIKSDAAPVTEEVTNSVLEAILGGAKPMEVLDYVRAMYEGIMASEVPLRDIVKSVTLNFDPERDESTSSALKGAKYGLQLGYTYQVGQRVRVVRLRDLEHNWLSIPEGEDIPPEVSLDWDYHANSTVLSPMRAVLEWVGLGDQVLSIRHGTRPSKQNRLR